MRSDLPEGWRWTRLSKEFSRITRKNEKGVQRVLSASGSHGLIDQHEFFNKRIASKKTSGYYLLKKGEFAYNRSSMKGYPYGAIKRLDRYPEGVLSTLYICFALREDSSVDSDFAAQLFDSDVLGSELAPIVQVGARAHGLLNVTVAEFFEVSMPLPPLPEQRKIAAILSSVDEAIQATEALIEQTRIVKEGMLQELFESAGKPKTEVTGPISQFGLVDCGKAKNIKQNSPLRPYLRVANVLDGRIDCSDVLTMPFSDHEFEQYKLEVGDILLNEGQSLELVGRPAVYQGSPPSVAMQNALLRWRPDPKIVLPSYGYQLIRYLYQLGTFSQVATQTTSIAHLGLKRFGSIKISIPSISDQELVVQQLTAIDDGLETHLTHLEGLKQLKAGLLQDLLTGKVRVSV